MSRRRKRKRTPVEASLARAQKYGLGYTKAGPDSWSVDSSTHEWRYQVTYAQGEWSCTCEARRYCMHVALIQYRTGHYAQELRKEAVRLQEAEERDWQQLVKQTEGKTIE